MTRTPPHSISLVSTSLISACSGPSMCSVVSFFMGSTDTAGRFSLIQRWTTGEARIFSMFSFSIFCRSRRSSVVLIAA